LIFAVSKKFWDGLTPEEQKLMTGAAKNATAYQRDLTAGEVDVAMKNMKDQGMQVTRFSEADLQKIRDLVPPAIEPHLEKIGPEFMSLLRTEIAAVRAGKKS